MIRNLKVLIAAAMALAAFGALSATAHAAEEKFHCSVEPCRATMVPDEVAGTTTAHHVWMVKGKTASGGESTLGLTCDQLVGEATSPLKTSTELTFTNLKYENAKGEQKCRLAGVEAFTVDFTSCDFNFKSAGGSKSAAQLHVLCTTAGDGIDINFSGTTCLQVTPFTTTGLGFHDSELGGKKKTVTASMSNVAIPAAALDLKNIGNSNCSLFGLTSIISATYTTGNTLIKTETDPAGVPAEAWFE